MALDAIEYIKENYFELFDFAMVVCRNDRPDAEDALHDALATACRPYEVIEAKEWFYKVISNQAKTNFRKKKRARIGLPEEIGDYSYMNMGDETPEVLADLTKQEMLDFIEKNYSKAAVKWYQKYFEIYCEKITSGIGWDEMQKKYSVINIDVVRARVTSILADFRKTHEKP